MLKFRIIIRWLAVLPIASLAMFAARYLAELMGKLMDYDVVEAIELTNGWGGHWIKGSLYILARQVIMLSAFILAGVLVAPSHHKAVSYALASILGIFVLVSTVAAFIVANEHGGIQGEFISRNAVFLFASGVGIAHPLMRISTGSTS